MRTLVLGTAGHIDHGKTTLVEALTGTDTDRLAEEKRRGITVDLGFARLPLSNEVEIGIVDVPGHDGFIRNMLAGASGIDLVMLVVAADEGVMPQTREHLDIVELLGVRGAVVAVTKTDRVEPEWLELVVDDLRTQLQGSAFADAPLVPVSGATGAGLDRLRDALYDAFAAVDDRPVGDLFRLPIDRVFTVRGTGTVVTGTLWSGTIERDGDVHALPAGVSGRVRSLQVHGTDVERAVAGQRTAVALTGIERDDLARGDVLVSSAPWRTTRVITASVRVLERSTWHIEHWQRVRLHLGTCEVMARVVPLDTDELTPGDTGWTQLRLENPIVCRGGDRFVLRSYSPVTTIGGGRVVEPVACKRNRLTDGERIRLEALASGGVAAAVAACAGRAGWEGVASDLLPVEAGFAAPRIRGELAEAEGHGTMRIGDRVFDAAVTQEGRRRVRHEVCVTHRRQPLRPGIEHAELRRALPTFAADELVAWCIDSLVADGELVSHDGWISLPGFEPELGPELREIRQRIVGEFERSGLEARSVDEVAAEAADPERVWALVKLLEHEGRLVAIAPDRFIDAAALDRGIHRVREAFGGRDDVSPGEFRELLSLSRKYLIPLLEYLDGLQVTVRDADTRTVPVSSDGA